MNCECFFIKITRFVNEVKIFYQSIGISEKSTPFRHYSFSDCWSSWRFGVVALIENPLKNQRWERKALKNRYPELTRLARRGGLRRIKPWRLHQFRRRRWRWSTVFWCCWNTVLLRTYSAIKGMRFSNGSWTVLKYSGFTGFFQESFEGKAFSVINAFFSSQRFVARSASSNSVRASDSAGPPRTDPVTMIQLPYNYLR